MTTRLLRFTDALFPDSIDLALAEHALQSGWVSGIAILEDVELRVFDPIAGRPGATRKIAGRVEAVSLMGPIVPGTGGKGAACQLRAVLSRQTDTGIETFAGQLVAALVLSFDGVAQSSESAGATAHAASASHVAPPQAPAAPAPSAPAHTAHTAPVAPVAPAPPAAAPSQPKASWGEAITTHTENAERAAREEEAAERAAREERQRAARANAPSSPSVTDAAPMPRPPARPAASQVEEVYPDAGDLADHFAFGRCEVVTSDGDRLMLRIPRDGRIKEIALEMLKVSRREDENGKRVYKLDRKM